MLSKIQDFVIQQWKSNKGYLIVSSFFSIIYVAISIVNYINFRTYTLDLGLYTSALWDYSHLQFNDGTAFHNFEENLLADHFDLYLMLFSPLSYLFGNFTLLFVQLVFVFIGGAGIMAVLKQRAISNFYALAGVTVFYSYFGLFSALAYDYHSNVVAAMVVPWFIYHVKSQRWKSAFFLGLFILIGKENMSIWLCFIALGLLYEERRNSNSVTFLAMIVALSCLYFIVVTNIIMPSLSVQGTYHHFHYKVLGSNGLEAIKTIVLFPIETLKYLWIDPNTQLTSPIKIEFWTFFFLSGGILLVAQPSALIMILPLLIQKLFHDNIPMWSVICQYSIEFSPIIGIYTILILNKIPNSSIKLAVLVLLLSQNYKYTKKLMKNVKAPIAYENISLVRRDHFVPTTNKRTVATALKLIPKNAAVSAQDPLVSQLAWRDKIYQYPIVRDAEYIVYSNALFNTYPLKREEFFLSIQRLTDSGNWKLIFDTNDISILQRTH